MPVSSSLATFFHLFMISSTSSAVSVSGWAAGALSLPKCFHLLMMSSTSSVVSVVSVWGSAGVSFHLFTMWVMSVPVSTWITSIARPLLLPDFGADFPFVAVVLVLPVLVLIGGVTVSVGSSAVIITAPDAKVSRFSFRFGCCIIGGGVVSSLVLSMSGVEWVTGSGAE